MKDKQQDSLVFHILRFPALYYMRELYHTQGLNFKATVKELKSQKVQIFPNC